MANETISGGIDAYYLQIAALAPVAGQPAPREVAIAKSNDQTSFNITIAQSILIFLAFALIGIIIYSVRLRKSIATIGTILFIGFIASGIPMTMRLLNQQATLESRASATFQPKNVRVTDVSPTSFVIAWDTDIPNIGVIRLRETKELTPPMTMISEDTAVMSHQVTATNLKSGTTYYFGVLSDGIWYADDGEPIQVTTLQ